MAHPGSPDKDCYLSYRVRIWARLVAYKADSGAPEFISPSVMIPEHRLASLLDQVKAKQISNCLYHNTSNSPSLYSDHMCDREQFPLCTLDLLSDHADEVYCVKFSHDGRRMASASKDKNVIIWEVEVQIFKKKNMRVDSEYT